MSECSVQHVKPGARTGCGRAGTLRRAADRDPLAEPRGSALPRIRIRAGGSGVGAIYYSDSDGSYDNILSERETNAMKKFINSTPNFSPKLTDRLTEVLKNDAVE